MDGYKNKYVCMDIYVCISIYKYLLACLLIGLEAMTLRW